MNTRKATIRVGLLPLGMVCALLGVTSWVLVVAASAPTGIRTVCLLGPPACQYPSIQAAVNAAADGDLIKVAAGTYTGVSSRPAPPGYDGPAMIKQMVYLDKSVTIRGGYTTAFTEPPDPEANPTILDAQDQGRVLLIPSDTAPIIDGLRLTHGSSDGQGQGSGFFSPDPGGGIYAMTSTLIISNTYVNGNTGNGAGIALHSTEAFIYDSTIADNLGGYGSGFALYLSQATLTRCNVDNNGGYFGAGLRLDFSQVTLVGCTVNGNNTGSGAGGGLSIWNSSATLIDSALDSNGADEGGALYVDSGQVTLIHNTLTGNESGTRGGAISLRDSIAILDYNTLSGNIATYSYSEGGGLVAIDSDITLTGNAFESNEASSGGGLHMSGSSGALTGNLFHDNAAGASGGGLYLFGSNATTLTGNVISHNTAGAGGGIALNGSNAAFHYTTVIGNVATQYRGGGIEINYCDPTLSATVLRANEGVRGGGLYLNQSDAVLTNTLVVDNQASEWGSGVYMEWSSPKLVHSTVAHNLAGDGTGIYIAGGQPELLNTIVVSHTTGLYAGSGAMASLACTLWGAGEWANQTDWGGPGTVDPGACNYWGDPAFLHPDWGNYHIGPGSAAKDVGQDAGASTDIDGQPRPNGPGYDIGFDEQYPWFNVYLPLIERLGP